MDGEDYCYHDQYGRNNEDNYKEGEGDDDCCDYDNDDEEEDIIMRLTSS